MRAESKTYAAPQAWVNGAWAQDVLLTVGADGHWLRIQAKGTPQALRDAERLSGPVLPGLVNAHSHAFQRAIVGLTERASAGGDDFWSWRDRMYSAALRITPEQLEAIAALLYAELLQAGYTQVCEFHYLHNHTDGKPYADPLAMSLALVRAAQRTGMGLTLLPTLYMRSGFNATGLREDQRRFASTPDSVLRLAEGVMAQSDSRVNTGLALHSLRAVNAAALQEVAAAARARGMAVHTHIAEQTQEVNDCVAATGQRPIEWLLSHAPVGAHWNLVHATQSTADELQGVQRSGAAIVICPNTEANLGDGVFDLPAYAAAGGRWSIGSDSHVTRSWQEELRLLEYSQRLSLRQRNIAARVLGGTSSADRLFSAALAGGSGATSLPLAGLAVGQRADFAVVDMASPALLGVPADHVLDAMVFSSPDARLSEVFVAGRRVLSSGQVPEWQRLAADFSQAMRALWA
ncbi:MAG: formimidoylglutamate deiminase [Pseudomonadota bacterium]|uniref:formimidoylglutamate deiminase n=1 Tax=Polaromonas sp. TaxID=1869339 RepID=UPI0017C99395|nr:formimidoylglutamate deiminase [Polaromonas sp.]MBA3593894.1 formimidoylglutamate deiminase [Polaromonas sp.]MDQ3271694.1 formimidoylglutamate deiminase [Pseudomonadota bacterium]